MVELDRWQRGQRHGAKLTALEPAIVVTCGTKETYRWWEREREGESLGGAAGGGGPRTTTSGVA
jgi:hypothetical protein